MTAPIPRDIPDIPALPGVPALLPSHVPASAVVTPVRHPLTAVYRLLVALMAAAGVTIDLLLGSPVRVLSYFTIQSNILLALVFVLSARRAWSARRPLPSALTGATLLYIFITGLVYHLLLAGASSPFSMTSSAAPPAGWQWISNQILHTAVPIAALLDWLFLTPRRRLHLRRAATWLLYPLAYLLFSFARGELILPGTPGRYLYPFLDVDLHSYKNVLANALLLGLAFYALAVLMVALDHTRPNPVRHRGKTGFRLQPPVG
ncbi:MULTISPECIES: Pr6Pr family membrane protein [unclassified Streptomyces]|uniref:Pr6Pr family membrane protein n=1 Tax=unclassified Streptomyces TaxID=2593676 RepID=UPI00225222D9|nr:MULTISPECIES: Pr6Pr family membrane protein [unclassified Streptomyces]MCX4882502.1 Pr6Pr family membrane protein [Streptomyces sp. NBC_00847]MCX5422526.1 Pr6Pr family membrane protein [Streptomyces sp. NBC_00078]